MPDTCLTCRHAVWKRTDAGRLHPGGHGLCQWKMPVAPIPKAMGWYGGAGGLVGGYISRRAAFTDCPTWEAQKWGII